MSDTITTPEKVLAGLEAMLDRGDLPPWAKPWRVAGSAAHVGAGGRPYGGVNVLLLEIAAMTGGYARRQWMTYRAIAAEGGQVTKGEHGTPVVLYRSGTRTETDAATGEETTRGWAMMRHYTVFNVEQTTGLTLPPIIDATDARTFSPVEAAEAITNGFAGRPKVLHGGGTACYVPATDTISMPDRAAFKSPAHYYGTLWHEMGHATGHATRLARKGVMDVTRFGSLKYGLEELVAETCAAILMGTSGIPAPPMENAAAYCAHWLHAIRADRAAFVRQAGHGLKAAAHIMGIAPTPYTAPATTVQVAA